MMYELLRLSSACVYSATSIKPFISGHCWLNKQSRLTEKLQTRCPCAGLSLIYRLMEKQTCVVFITVRPFSRASNAEKSRKKITRKSLFQLKLFMKNNIPEEFSSSASDYVKCNKSHTHAVCVSRQQMFACAKSLFISDQDKRKHFCLLLRLFLGNRQEVGSFQSRMIKVISKPSQKRQSMKNADRGFIPLLIQQIRDFHLFLNWGKVAEMNIWKGLTSPEMDICVCFAFKVCCHFFSN